MARRKGDARRKLPFFLSLITVITGILLVTTILQKNNNLSSSSITFDERIEDKQNTIPPDVLAKIEQEEKVLGVKTVHVPILLYHYVEYVQDKGDTIRISLNITPYTFEEEIKTLLDAGYTFLTNRELTQVMEGKRKLPKKPIVLTFDDGLRDFYTDAYPILKKYNAKATQYVIAGFLDWNQNHMLKTQVAEIANDGLVEIGAHTVNHVWLKGQTQGSVRYEVSESKKMLEDIIKQPVVSFAYPYGAFDVQAIDEVKKAGFSSAVSTVPGIDQVSTNKYFLYRLKPGGRTGESLLSWLSTVTNSE